MASGYSASRRHARMAPAAGQGSSIFVERRDQPLTGTREPGHYSSYRHLCCLGDFPVIEAFDVPELERLAKWRGQCRDSPPKLLGISFCDQSSFRGFAARIARVGMFKFDRFEVLDGHDG